MTDQNEIEQDCQFYSDLYKDYWGTRPPLSTFRTLPEDARQELIDDVSRLLKEELDREVERREEADAGVRRNY